MGATTEATAEGASVSISEVTPKKTPKLGKRLSDSEKARRDVRTSTKDVCIVYTNAKRQT